MISIQCVPDHDRIAAATVLGPHFPNGVVQVSSRRALRSLGPAFAAMPRGVVVFGSLTRGGALQGRLRAMLWGWLRRWGGAVAVPRKLACDHFLTPLHAKRLYRGGGRCAVPVLGFCTEAAAGVVYEHRRQDGQLIWLAGEWGRQSEHGRTFRIYVAPCGGAEDVPRVPMVVDLKNLAAWCDPRTRSEAAVELAREPDPEEFLTLQHRGWPPAHAWSAGPLP